METRASYIAVGSFVIALLAGLVIAFLWFADTQLSENMRATRPISPVSARASAPARRFASTACSSAASPRWRSIPTLRRASASSWISPAPRRIRSDSVASLEIQSLAGTTAIEINAGTKDAPPIQIQPRTIVIRWSGRANPISVRSSMRCPILLVKITELLDQPAAFGEREEPPGASPTRSTISRN